MARKNGSTLGWGYSLGQMEAISKAWPLGTECAPHLPPLGEPFLPIIPENSGLYKTSSRISQQQKRTLEHYFPISQMFTYVHATISRQEYSL